MGNAIKFKIKPPLRRLPIGTADSGFYHGFNRYVTVTSKIIVTALILWAIVFPTQAGRILEEINENIIQTFSTWYVYATATFVIASFVLAIAPQSGKLKLGVPDEKPEFSRFSWFSMMFGAGIGIGMLTYSTGEPIFHLQNNPEVIRGNAEAVSHEVVRPAFTYSFLHWGFSPWAAYALTGLVLSYFSYRRALPLTIRSSLAPLFGNALSGALGHLVDIVAVVATVLGVAVTLGYGLEQFVAGLHRVGLGDWLLNDQKTASNAAIIVALTVIVGGSTLSALSGVGRGIKWLSNINMSLSFGLLLFFLIFGATLFSLKAFFIGVFDYVVALPQLMFSVMRPDGTETGDALAQWQLDWTVFYWAWWVAFTPFVGMFLARISRGRTIREYIIGTIIAPSAMCFTWFALVGGTAIDLELRGLADGAILSTGISDQLYATLSVMLSESLAFVFSGLVVLLLYTYLVTSADSAILIINTINAAGDESSKAHPHILFWGVSLALVVGGLLIVGGLEAMRTAMIIGALPFSFVMILMVASIFKAVISDIIRERHGISTTTPPKPLPVQSQ